MALPIVAARLQKLAVIDLAAGFGHFSSTPSFPDYPVHPAFTHRVVVSPHRNRAANDTHAVCVRSFQDARKTIITLGAVISGLSGPIGTARPSRRSVS
jgi:hypothetical protein